MRQLLTTPPATRVHFEFAEHEALHTRPRHDMLRSMEALPKVADDNGLPPRMLRHIEEFIDSHLD
jgi:hypothetical protein